MEVKCEFCGNLIPDNEEKCPNCGAPNPNMQRGAAGIPQTIEELKKWYEDHNLPPYETTRFFIGVDCREPHAFGIYRDGKEFIVYKNKSDGSRAMRYRGTDEDYAVNELYLKLKSEIVNQKELNAQKSGGSAPSPIEPETGETGRKGDLVQRILVILVTALIIAGIVFPLDKCSGTSPAHDPDSHYYSGSNNSYYYFDTGNYSSGSSGSSYNSNYSNHFDTWDHDWDSGFDWDSGDSWDSGGSDWDSDW